MPLPIFSTKNYKKLVFVAIFILLFLLVLVFILIFVLILLILVFVLLILILVCHKKSPRFHSYYLQKSG